MSKKDTMAAEFAEEEQVLKTKIEAGETALVNYQQKMSLIEDTGFNMAKNLGILDETEVQISMTKVHEKYEQNVRKANGQLETLNEELVKMQKEHETALEKTK